MICSIQIRIVDRLNLALYSSSQIKLVSMLLLVAVRLR